MRTSKNAHALGLHPKSCEEHEPHTSECPDPCIHECCPQEPEQDEQDDFEGEAIFWDWK